jgi:hypothetical protein
LVRERSTVQSCPAAPGNPHKFMTLSRRSRRTFAPTKSVPPCTHRTRAGMPLDRQRPRLIIRLLDRPSPDTTSSEDEWLHFRRHGIDARRAPRSASATLRSESHRASERKVSWDNGGAARSHPESRVTATRVNRCPRRLLHSSCYPSTASAPPPPTAHFVRNPKATWRRQHWPDSAPMARTGIRG